ncbi:hypothetical protein PUN28_014337 [Cardiocondyla obscurior]|uniref:Uncharacterized protein n=1 Tax=Cardiocondyla obscurior TaxID=286306 RepID=A0AAW2F185_9HYME
MVCFEHIERGTTYADEIIDRARYNNTAPANGVWSSSSFSTFPSPLRSLGRSHWPPSLASRAFALFCDARTSFARKEIHEERKSEGERKKDIMRAGERYYARYMRSARVLVYAIV